MVTPVPEEMAAFIWPAEVTADDTPRSLGSGELDWHGLVVTDETNCRDPFVGSDCARRARSNHEVVFPVPPGIGARKASQ